jgi:hypothetical protein
VKTIFHKEDAWFSTSIMKEAKLGAQLQDCAHVACSAY